MFCQSRSPGSPFFPFFVVFGSFINPKGPKDLIIMYLGYG